MVEIPDINYNQYVQIIGTAHFTRRSLNDAYNAIKSMKPADVALELDWNRFNQLNTACLGCSRHGYCKGFCEFTRAADALGNVDANIWLIDMTEHEMNARIRGMMTPIERTRLNMPMYTNKIENPLWLWEKGFKEQVINNSKKQIEANRRFLPSIIRVLIEERNALMAARLSWITAKILHNKEHPLILTFVGAAHVEGITKLLATPILIRDNLKSFNLSFTEPTLIRRIAVQAA